MLGKANSCGIRCGNRAVTRQRHADCFRQAVHRICRIHAGAGSAGRAGVFFIVTHAFFVQRPRIIGADCLKHMAQAAALPVFQMPCQHRAAGNKDRRDIEAGSCHQEPGNVFVAVRDHDKPVKLMGNGHCFGRVCNQVTRNEGILHPNVAHGNSVTNGNGREHDRCAACSRNPCLNGFCDFIKIHMPGNNFIVRTYHADQRAADLFVGKTERIEQAAVRCPLYSFFNKVRLHNFSSPFFNNSSGFASCFTANRESAAEQIQ